MNLSEFFKSAAVSLPRGGFQEGKTTFDRFLGQAFRQFIAAVRLLDDPEFPNICSEAKRSLGTLEQLSKQIVAAVKHYLAGHPDRAYDEVEKSLALVNIEKLFSTLSAPAPGRQFRDDFEYFLERILHPPLYRIRADRRPATRKDIFHVPFEKRRHVGNQRYSISGLPCLYLGSSVWICWEELDRPQLSSVSVSRFRFAEEVKVLDLQFPPSLAWFVFEATSKRCKAADEGDSYRDLRLRFDEKFIASYILCWPLIAACSMNVGSREGSFFPQYIVPQILLQWVTQEQRVDGIRYFSTRTPSQNADVWAHYSCVFPARKVASAGHCSYLKSKFHLTAPISWEMIETFDGNASHVLGPSNGFAVVNLSNDFRVQYNSTGFFKAEEKLGWIEGLPDLSGPVDAKIGRLPRKRAAVGEK